MSMITELRLLGKTCMITGGSRGIGLAISKKLSENGASCKLVSRNQQLLDSALSQLNVEHAQKHESLSFDVSRLATNEPEVADLQNLMKGIDILINCAGLAQNSLLLSTKVMEINNLINVNLLATILCSRLAIKPMLRKREGCIINFSSVLAKRGSIGTSVYAATKAGIEGFTNSLAVELGPKNIRVNSICPGLVDTEMGRAVSESSNQYFQSRIPLKSIKNSSVLINADEIANATLFLATSSNITGTTLTIDKGFSC